MTAHAAAPESFVRLPDLDAPWAEASPGVRLAAVRRATRALHDRLTAAGPAVCVRTWDMGTAPYPVRFGLEGMARSRLPFLFIKNRMQLVQATQGGRLVNVDLREHNEIIHITLDKSSKLHKLVADEIIGFAAFSGRALCAFPKRLYACPDSRCHCAHFPAERLAEARDFGLEFLDSCGCAGAGEGEKFRS